MRKKAAISFSMVYIPVSLYTSVSENETGFNQIHKKCGNRIRYKKVCPHCNEEVGQEDIVKGYEYEPDKYVLISDEDLEAIKDEKDKSIQIQLFIEASAVDPIFYDKSYYVLPDGSDKAFALLMQAMNTTGKVAIAKAILGTSETLALIRPTEHGLLMTTLYYAEEVKAIPHPVITASPEQAELDMAVQIIGNMAGEFRIEDFHDGYAERIRALIEQKIQGKEVVQAAVPQKGNIISLMDALAASVEKTAPSPSDKPKRRSPAKKAQ